MQSSKILLKDGQIVDLVDGRINDGDIDTWNNKLNVEITSNDNTVQVSETTNVQTNTKTFDISVNTDIVATNKDVSDLESNMNYKLDSKEDVSNKIQVVNDSSTTEYPSSKAVANFVNSSVSTNTATFLGNFSLEDLGLTYPATEVQIASALNSHTWPTGYPTNNDYVYVEISNPQSSIYDKVQRYKYRGSVASWGYEYTLNNSSFTSEEMAAIDSGITSQDVTNLRSDHTTLESHVHATSNPHSVTKAQVGLSKVDNTSDADKPVSTAQQNALNKKLDKTGDASNTTASFTKNSGDTSSMTSSKNLSTIFTAISSFFASLKALAFKDKVSDSDINGTISDSHIASSSTWNSKYTKPSTGIPKTDLASGVQASLGKADTALQSHQDISGKADKSNITGATKCKITYNSQGIVTAGNDLSASDIPNLAASKITSGTFGTARIADDAITAAKVKDNETLPVNISGTATKATQDSDGNNIKTNYMKASSGNKSLSFGSTTTIGTTNGNNVNLVMPAADSDTFYVSANSTSFSDVLAAYNANKKLILQIGFPLPGTLTAAYNIPLNRIVYSDDTPVIFVWVYTQDSLTGDTNRGVITTWSLGSTGWASEEKYTYFADTAGLSNKASGLMDFGDKDQQKVTRVGWAGSSIGKVIASGNSQSLSESSYLAAYYVADGIGHVKDVKAENVTVGKATKASTADSADSAKSVNATVGNSITSTGTNGSMEILNGALSSSSGGGGSCSIDGDGISFTKGVVGSSMTADGISTAGTGTFTGGVEAKGRTIDGSATFVNRASIYWSPRTTNLVVNRAAASTTTIDLKDLLNGVVYWLHVPVDNIIALKNSAAKSTFYCYNSSFTTNSTTVTYNIRSNINDNHHGGFSSAIVRNNNNFYVMMEY